MKKFFITVLILFSIFWIGRKYYNYLDSITLFSSQAVFELFFDIDENDIDDFFLIKPGTYDKNRHKIICKLPVKVPIYSKAVNKIVEFGTENIICSEKFDKKRHIKYDSDELNNSNAVLMIVDNKSLIEIMDYDMPIAGKVYASRIIKFDYEKGKINHLIISKDSIYEYCK